MTPLSADELEQLRATTAQALTFWQDDDSSDAEVADNIAFYSDVIRLIHYYQPPVEKVP